MSLNYESINLLFGVAVIILGWYYLKHRDTMEEMSRRLILVGIMFSTHELSFLLYDDTIFQLTEVLLIIVLIYALLYVTEVNKKVTATAKSLEDAKEAHDALISRLEVIKEKSGK